MTSPAKTAENSPASPVSWRQFLLVGLAVVWLLVFFSYFYAQELSNAQQLADGSRPTRLLVWEYLHEIFLDNLLPVREPGAAPAGWRYLPQRFGFLAVAGLVYGVAYLLGTGLFHLWGANIKAMGRLEWHSLALATGLSGLSLLTLGLGLAGQLNRIAFVGAYLGIVLFWAGMHIRAAGGVTEWTGRIRSWAMLKYFKWSQKTFRVRSPRVWGSVLIAPFLFTILLGAMLPEVDFDVKEYHFGGPKEYYLAGYIHFLPHNVYTSFPFLTEMLTLTGMVLYGDWYWGAVAGKTILCGFAPLTALLTGVLVRRWWGVTAGWLAAVVQLSIPWTYRISIIAYTEGGLSLFLAASMLAAAVCVASLAKKKATVATVLIAGFLAGSAAACKYPGLISVTIPIALFLLGAYVLAVRGGTRSWGQLWQAAGIFVLGTVLSFGPWLAKNMAETGNPVYPLLYSVFGGEDWDDTLNEKWKRGHSPDHHRLAAVWTNFLDVFVLNDWQSPLILGFGVIGSISSFRQQRAGRWLTFYLIWLLATWWILTHRLDRFWVPLLPVGSALAAVGIVWLSQWLRWFMPLVLLPPLIFNLGFITTELCGYNAYVTDLNSTRQITARITSPEIVFLHEYLKDRPGKVLFVGEAELFDAEFPYVYNTVFDRSLFAEWTGAVDRNRPEGEWEFRTTAEIREKLRAEGITEILVNWQEILRYRTTYGYTDYVTPERFRELQHRGLIGAAVEPHPFYQSARALSPQQRQEVEQWAPELIVRREDGEEYFITTQLFPVLPE